MFWIFSHLGGREDVADVPNVHKIEFNFYVSEKSISPLLQCAVQSKAKMFWILFSFSFYVGDACHMQLRPVMYISQPILQVLCQYNAPDLQILHLFLCVFDTMVDIFPDTHNRILVSKLKRKVEL